MNGGNPDRVDLVFWALLAAANAVALIILWQTGWWLYRLDGSPWAHDYIAQWASGFRVLSGNAALVYDWAGHSAYQARLIGAPKPVELYVFYPPHFLFTTPAFAWLGHVQASLAFLLVTASAYAASLYLWVRNWEKAALVAVAGGGAFYSIWWTQNGFLTAALFTAGLAFLNRRPVVAGIFFGLLTIKPQLGLLIPVALLVSGNWRAIVSATVTFLLLAIAAEAFLGEGIWETFFTSISEASGFLQSGNLWFKQQSLFALLFPIYGPGVAWVFHSILALTVAAIVAWMWCNRGSHWNKSSALMSASLLVTPYLYPYDAVLLTAAAVMLLYEGHGPTLSRWERVLVFLCCLAPMATRFIYSAAVPLAALILLYIAVHRAKVGERIGPRDAATSIT
ncbi:MAG TPA: glycosyltransferase family 87 protein [Sphingomicrobium sp.]|nr:glycosyltransferase family 87 protein [Sphingomicrobium sp.]